MATNRDVSKITAFARRCFPNWALLVAVLMTLTLEILLLWDVESNVYRSGGAAPWCAVLFLVWFWFSIALCLHAVGRYWQQLGRAKSATLAVGMKLGIVCAVTFSTLVYVASWGMFLQMGRFANLEAILFLVNNPPQTTWLYLGSGERIAIALAGVGVLALAVAVPWIMRVLACTSWPEVYDRKFANRVWRWLTIGVVGCTFFVLNDLSLQRRTRRLDTLKYCLNPVISLSASSLESLALEPIEACLKTSELVAQGQQQWELPPGSKRPSIIILAIESLRHDVVGLKHQGREVMPNLNALLPDSLQMTRAYAQSTHSDYSDVCIVSSLYPLRTRRHHYYRSDDPWPKTCIYDLLKQAGYQTAICSSQNEAWGGMDQFLESPNLDLFYDAKRSGAKTYVSQRDPGFAHEISVGTFDAGCLEDSHTTDVAIGWIEKNVRNERPFFLSMNFQSSHFPYELPAGVERPFQPCRLDPDVSFMSYPVEKTDNVRNAYFNGLHECDRQLGRIVESLKKQGILSDTLLVVLGENGEAFHENGSVGHAREPVEPAVHVATVIHAPRWIAPGKNDYPLEHVDLVPTLFGALGWPAHPNFQGIDVLAGSRPERSERLLFFHVLSAAAAADAVTLAGRWKLVKNYRFNTVELFDLKHDPQEAYDVSPQYPELAARLRESLRTWRKRQLAFYHFPMYYKGFYPPQPPRWKPLPEIAQPQQESGDVLLRAAME